ncbi:hypothetical protein FOTG_18596 [Fusarium oxysporum f. sp. vasinfectum 25433]|uniref:Uncharacterized protein n=1 Tax=Fusarium oxysporum f. sp. vasinfectum 25433 TaxID=1089449 RepID=X0KW61_FUSOX|nr:hypothetical protein FOTG_18596 [Fusarium oxysporum f. sp. vasinfectum 25433]
MSFDPSTSRARSLPSRILCCLSRANTISLTPSSNLLSPISSTIPAAFCLQRSTTAMSGRTPVASKPLSRGSRQNGCASSRSVTMLPTT